jgi:hypothetical protein
MDEADQSNADLPSVVGDALGVPALPAPLGNDPVSREIEALPAILHRSAQTRASQPTSFSSARSATRIRDEPICTR